MLSRADNELISQTGKGTPMGGLMRSYWMPILRSQQLQSGGSPERVRVMGGAYVAYRTTTGEVGLMDEACPHRGASLTLGRVEDCGLRCVYHGWMFAPSGELLETPTYEQNEPPRNVAQQVRKRIHPVHEAQGIIWAYLGGGEPPAFPRLAFTGLPTDHVLVATAALNCNWLHPLETLWDVFHAQILHNQTNRASVRASYYFSNQGRASGDLRFDYPTMHVERKPYGFSYANDDAIKTTRFEFVLPFIQFHTTTPGVTDDRAVQISVPIDDGHCVLWQIMYNRFAPLKEDGLAKRVFSDVPDLNNFMAGMDERTPENRWGQDRAAIERGESFSGVTKLRGAAALLGEDVIAIESQGEVDRAAEILAPTDRAVIEGRRTVLDAVRAYVDGAPPPGRDLDLTHIEAVFTSKIVVPDAIPSPA